ncbi:MAG TPA: diguanylate cyclase, partial [Geminicoccaceae bacterium]
AADASIEAAIEAAMEPAIEPAIEPAVEPAIEPAIEPDIEPDIEPAIELAMEPAIELAIQPAIEPASEPPIAPAIDAPARTALLALRDGDAAFAAGDAAAAVAFSQLAVDAARRAGDGSLEARALTRLGEARRAQGDHDLAIAALNQALKAARRLGVTRSIAAAHRELSLACEAAERFEPALLHFKAFHGIEVERLRGERRPVPVRMAAAPDVTATPVLPPSGFLPLLDPAPATREAPAVAAASTPLAREGPAKPPVEAAALPELAFRELVVAPASDAPSVPQPAPEPTVDLLTRLGNALAFERRLAHSMADARLDVALLALDVDHLASLNETFSPASGDDVIRRVGLVLLEQLKPGDAAFRVGGGRFQLLLHGPAARTATAVAERLHRAVGLHPWHEVAPGLAVTASLGVAVARPGADDADLLHQRARHALATAKEQGRDRVAVDEP